MIHASYAYTITTPSLLQQQPILLFDEPDVPRVRLGDVTCLCIPLTITARAASLIVKGVMPAWRSVPFSSLLAKAF
jgi:hypothetical protein